MLEVTYKGTPVGLYVADILVEDRDVVELKALELLTKAHEAQLLNYLKASGKRVGLLVNITHPKAEIRRLLYDSFRVLPCVSVAEYLLGVASCFP